MVPSHIYTLAEVLVGKVSSCHDNHGCAQFVICLYKLQKNRSKEGSEEHMCYFQNCKMYEKSVSCNVHGFNFYYSFH